MAQLERIASHDGLVKGIKKGMVAVEIVSTSACATCSAHAHCGFAESKTKMVDVPTANWQNYHEGEQVKVNIDENRGMLAVWIAYVIPAIVLLGVIIVMSIAHLPEWVVAFSALAALGIYIAILYKIRSKIETKFTLTVEKC